jgi:hypothetical protein
MDSTALIITSVLSRTHLHLADLYSRLSLEENTRERFLIEQEIQGAHKLAQALIRTPRTSHELPRNK